MCVCVLFSMSYIKISLQEALILLDKTTLACLAPAGLPSAPWPQLTQHDGHSGCTNAGLGPGPAQVTVLPQPCTEGQNTDRNCL